MVWSAETPDISSYKPCINFPSRRECQKTFHVRVPVQHFATCFFLGQRIVSLSSIPCLEGHSLHVVCVINQSTNQSVSSSIYQLFIYQSIFNLPIYVSIYLSIHLITIYGYLFSIFAVTRILHPQPKDAPSRRDKAHLTWFLTYSHLSLCRQICVK